MILQLIVSAVLAAAATFDGIWTAKAQAKGAMEIGPSHIIYGPHPTNADLIYKGGAIILSEILGYGIVMHNRPMAIQIALSIPLLAQSVFHVFGGLSGIHYVRSVK